MFKKYKIKKKKIINIYIIFFIILLSTFFMAYGYSLLSDTTTIKGRANILSNDTSNSTYSWKAPNTWGTGNNWDPTWYQLEFTINNNDADISEWTLNFDVQDGILPERTNAWSASSTSVSGNTVTMVCQSWNGYVVSGGSVTLGFQLAFSNALPMSISNVKLNGKSISLAQ